MCPSLKEVDDRTLYRWWNKHFWDVDIKKWTKFATCDICAQNRGQALTANEETKKVLGENLDSHRSVVVTNRQRLSCREAFIG